jgi:hypothetical protein
MPETGAPRRRLAFRIINRPTDPGYEAAMQRHHLLPRQLLSAGCFALLWERLGRDRVGFDDFRRNGLLLPCTERAAVGIGLPLHRGPHRSYNAMVFERVGEIEGGWAARRLRVAEDALEEALFRLALLQQALRRRLRPSVVGCCSIAPIHRASDATSPNSMPWQSCFGAAPTRLKRIASGGVAHR